MNDATALPTRRDEAFRYTDLDALSSLWPVAREEVAVPAGSSDAMQVVELGEANIARHLVVTLEKGARFDLVKGARVE